LGQQSEFEENSERYLLGELSDAERERFEESYFADDALFEQLQAVKDDLLDAYARGELDGEKRKRFAAHFLASAPNRRQLEETQKFIRAVTAVGAKTAATDNAAVVVPLPVAVPESAAGKSFGGFFNLRRFAWQAALAVVLLMALAGSWLILRDRQPAATVDRAVVQPAPLPVNAAPANENNVAVVNNNAAVTPRPTTPANVNKSPESINQPPVKVKTTPSPTPKKPADRPLQNRQPVRAQNQLPVNERKDIPFSLTLSTVGRDPGTISSITLSPVTSRDIGDENSLDIYRTTRKARLRLVFKGDGFRRYNAVVTTVDGEPVWQKRGLKAGRGSGEKSVTLQLPAALLTKQDYLVTLKGQSKSRRTETVGEYYFRVTRE
jgi:hypothetical protein